MPKRGMLMLNVLISRVYSRHVSKRSRKSQYVFYVHDMTSDLLIRIKLVQNMEIDFLFAAVKPHFITKLN